MTRLRAEFASVKVVVKVGDIETTYDLPLVQDLDIKAAYPSRHWTEPPLQSRLNIPTSITFMMRPLPDGEGCCMMTTVRDFGEQAQP